jgi:hypothetical protein
MVSQKWPGTPGFLSQSAPAAFAPRIGRGIGRSGPRTHDVCCPPCDPVGGHAAPGLPFPAKRRRIRSSPAVPACVMSPGRSPEVRLSRGLPALPGAGPGGDRPARTVRWSRAGPASRGPWNPPSAGFQLLDLVGGEPGRGTGAGTGGRAIGRGAAPARQRYSEVQQTPRMRAMVVGDSPRSIRVSARRRRLSSS